MEIRPGNLPALALGAALLALTRSAAGAAAMSDAPRLHEGGTLEVSSRAVPAGATLAVRGKDFSPGEAYTLRLEGTLRSHDVAEVEPDSSGAFSLELRIPREVSEGRYRLAAVAPDGDVSTRLELRVLAARPAAASREPAGDGDGSPASAGPVARDGEIPLERSRSGVEWGVIGLVLGLSGGLGLGLLAGGSRRGPPSA